MTIASIKAEIAANLIIKELPTDLKISIPVMEALLLLKRILYIYHPLWFKKDQVKVQALLNSGSKVNTITSTYVAKLDFKV